MAMRLRLRRISPCWVLDRSKDSCAASNRPLGSGGNRLPEVSHECSSCFKACWNLDCSGACSFEDCGKEMLIACRVRKRAGYKRASAVAAATNKMAIAAIATCATPSTSLKLYRAASGRRPTAPLKTCACLGDPQTCFSALDRKIRVRSSTCRSLGDLGDTEHRDRSRRPGLAKNLSRILLATRREYGPDVWLGSRSSQVALGPG